MARPPTFEERARLEEMAEGREGYEASRRARTILLSSSGYGPDQIGLVIPMHVNHVRKWIKRFNKEGIEGIKERRRGGRPKKYGHEVEREVIGLILENSPKKGEIWTLKKIQEALGGKPAL